MTRARKLTLSVKEFTHLVSESLDISHAHASPSPQSLVKTTVVSEAPPQNRSSSFHRIFSRPSAAPEHHEDSPEKTPEDFSEAPRRMIGWPFSRSPRKNPPAEDEENTADDKDPDISQSVSPYSVTSLVAASTSSLGSLVPVHERLFQITSRDSDEPSQSSDLFKVVTPSPGAIAPSQVSEIPTNSGRYAVAIPSDPIFGNEFATRVCTNSMVELPSGVPWQGTGTRNSSEGTEISHSVVDSEPESFAEDLTPRASTLSPRAMSPPTTQRRRSQRLSIVISSRNMDVFALRPAIGVTPHVPSETESSTSGCSASSPTSPTFPTMRSLGSGISSPPAPPNPRILTVFPHHPSRSNMESTPLGFPRQPKRPISRSVTPPPLPRPPPTGPLPAVPSFIPPVPPLPPFLNKTSANMLPHPVLSSPPRPTNPGVVTAPHSPPGALRLPSRLSWVNSVRAVLPSPPASPTRSPKSLNGKTALSIPTSKAEKKRSKELKRPTSIGIIEAADNVQVRRTKSILLLGSRSKSHASLGAKRVQIHADVNLDVGGSRKARRKSSAVVVGHHVSSSDVCPGTTSAPGSELLVPRERRHSAPLLSSRVDSNVPGRSSDWTLSLPFSTDVPGNKIPISPLLTPKLEPALEEVHSEDWTLCMPLKLRVEVPPPSEGCDSECAPVEASQTAEEQTATQLPTPSPSPKWSTPSSVLLPLDAEEDMPSMVDRPVSPESLGPHVGGLNLAGGHGKRASGWHVYGWFDEVSISEDEDHVASMSASSSKLVKNHVTVFRKTHDASGRHPSQESMCTVSTSDTLFYSARSSLLVN